ncbi:progonadoliberin-3 [Amia ocellicauda]|uniref:progonadoliberin-3 n=1 Tax=Amia ocellicauda TaxID=2972642 RepID=UPI0034646235
MELTRSVLHLAILACVAQISCSQHWSYGWLPGGKRSVDELEATLEMIDSRNHMTVAEEPSPQYVLDKLSPFDSVNSIPIARM